MDKIYFGGYRSLRGIPIGKYLGNNSIVLSCEYRMPLYGFNKNSSSGSAVYLFSDFGVLSDTLKEIETKNIKHDTGVGFIWLLSKDSVFRFDLSLSPKIKFTIGTGYKF